jgi:hypothetical protein
MKTPPFTGRRFYLSFAVIGRVHRRVKGLWLASTQQNG